MNNANKKKSKPSIPVSLHIDPGTVTGAETRTSLSRFYALKAELVAELGRELELGPELGVKDRRRLSVDIARSPAELVEAVASLAARSNGRLAGIAIDADRFRTVLARHAAASELIRELRHVAQRLEDDIVDERADVGRQSLAVVWGLEGAVRAGDGVVNAGKVRELRALARKGRPRRRGAKSVAPLDAAVDTPVGPTVTEKEARPMPELALSTSP